MAFVCIPREKIAEFRKALKTKELNIAELINMETEQRTALLEKFAGTEAKSVNTLFEEKLVLKNRIQGLKNWASKVGEVGRYDPKKQEKLDQMISEYRAKQQERMFSPKEHESFLADLVEEKFGTRISREEANNIFELTTKTDELKQFFNENTGEWASKETKANYGASKVALENYVKDLKDENLSLKDIVKGRESMLRQEFADNKPLALFNLAKDTTKTISDNSVSMVATLDNSFLGRQGLKTLITHPTVWWDGAINSFKDIAGTLGGRNMEDALMADIYSSPNYLNGKYELAKLLPKTEEQFPTTLPERIWGLGRVFKASEVAFKGSAVRMRTGLFDLLEGMAKETGLDTADKKVVGDLGKLVNSMTARGQWGTRGEGIMRLVLWAPRMLKANLDVLTGHGFGVGLETAFARKQAAVNLFKIVATTAVVMKIANAIKPGSAELDPRSSNFGKLKFGNTSFDITGGMGSILVLASRMASGKYKSSVTGVVSEYGKGYGAPTRYDAFIDFLTNKTTPPVHTIIDLMKGKDFSGKEPTVGSALYGAFTPISIQNIVQLKDDSSVSAVLGVILDGLGFNASTYQPSSTDWSQSMGVELQQFRDKVGDTKFVEANNAFNQEYSEWLNNTITKSEYQKLSDEDKKAVVAKKKEEIKQNIFKRYNFKYKQVKKPKTPKI